MTEMVVRSAEHHIDTSITVTTSIQELICCCLILSRTLFLKLREGVVIRCMSLDGSCIIYFTLLAKLLPTRDISGIDERISSGMNRV